MNPLMLLKGDTLGKTIYNAFILIAVVGMLAFVGAAVVTGKFWHWRANVANERADRAEATAQVATRNAENANAGAANATATRQALDTQRVQISVTTEQSAQRVENGKALVDDSGDLDADLVRELDAARTRAGTAANRLQRAGSR